MTVRIATRRTRTFILIIFVVAAPLSGCRSKTTELELCPALLLVFAYRRDSVPIRELAKPMNCWIEKPCRQALCACSEEGFRLYSRTAEKGSSRQPAFVHPHTYPLPRRIRAHYQELRVEELTPYNAVG